MMLLSILVAFSEYMNFNCKKCYHTGLKVKIKTVLSVAVFEVNRAIWQYFFMIFFHGNFFGNLLHNFKLKSKTKWDTISFPLNWRTINWKHVIKGQVISKGFSVSSISSKKRTKTSRIVVKSNSFVRFLEELTAWQFAFEINWPLPNLSICKYNWVQLKGKTLL